MLEEEETAPTLDFTNRRSARSYIPLSALVPTSHTQYKHSVNSTRLRYLRGTEDYELVYGGEKEWTTIFEGFTDSDHGGTITPGDTKSTSGYAFMLAGGAIAWSSKRQPCTALSTMEAEYMAATHSTIQATWLRYLFDELGFQQTEPTDLFCDNQAAITISRDPTYFGRSRHINIRHHFVREKVEDKTIDLTYIPSADNTADIFTKALAAPAFEFFAWQLGLMAN
jgi:hypothetical protein